MEKRKVMHAIHAIREAIGDEDEDRDIKKSYPAKQEWIKRFAELEKMADEASRLRSKITSMSEGLWADIKQDLELYGEDLHYSEEDREIQVYAD